MNELKRLKQLEEENRRLWLLPIRASDPTCLRFASAGFAPGGTTCGKSRAKLTISRLDEIFYAGFLSVKGCKVDILTMFGAQFALMVQDRSLKRGEAPVWGVVSSDTNLHPRPALLFV